MTTDEQYMSRCFQLAELGAGNVAPNPMVGAVLVYEDKIIGEGYHQKYGEAHAEVNCINSVKEENKILIEKALYMFRLNHVRILEKRRHVLILLLKIKLKK